MKKLLHLQLLPLLSGAQNFSLHLLEGLPAGEFEIWVACQPGGDLVAEVKKRGYHYLPLRFLRHPLSPLDLPAFLEMWWQMRRHRFDIVHANSSKTGLLGRLAARLAGVPLILYTAHGTAFQDGQSPLARRAFQCLEKLGNSWGHKTVFVNNSDREKCLSLGLVPPEKALTVYNALPASQAQRLAKLAANRGLDTDKRDFVIGSTLRFSTQKNVVSLISAACQACKQQSKLRFIILGDGEYLSLCRRIVQSHGLNERILLPGWDNQVDKWLLLFDAFILYSRWEAQPFSVIEAMRSGLAVIGSDIPSLRELVDNETGWLVALDDQAALVNCLVEVASAPLTALDKGKNAAQKIARLCDHDQMVQAYLRLYRSLPDEAQNP